jgi:alkylation response protein AidB-like acyl-CoA dehydrogenase
VSDYLAALAALRPDDGDLVRATGTWAAEALDAGLLDLPLPGGGRTGERLDRLADLGRLDLDLARLAEGHADAVAVLADLDADPVDGLWGVWAAHPPHDPVRAERRGDGWSLTGTKPWCSGAGACRRALVTADADDGYRLFAVDLSHDGAAPVPGSWPAPAMRGSDSRSMRFDAVPAYAVGEPDAYLQRPGFWHGAVGVAAVWAGGAGGVAAALRRSHAKRPLHAHALAHAGAVDAGLAAADALLADAARTIDADPEDKTGDARLVALRVRAVVEQVVADVVDRTGRALGPAPLALDAEHAKRVADLGLYVRQSHAERDLEELGSLALEQAGTGDPTAR